MNEQREIETYNALRALGFGATKLQSWNTPDGGGFGGNLTFKGKVVAQIHQGGNGGPVDLAWGLVSGDRRVLVLGAGGALRATSPDLSDRQRAALEKKGAVVLEAKAALEAFTAALPERPFGFAPGGYREGVDDVAESFISGAVDRKALARQMKGKLWARVETMPADEWTVQRLQGDKPTEAERASLRAYMLKKHNGATVIFADELYGV